MISIFFLGGVGDLFAELFFFDFGISLPWFVGDTKGGNVR